MIARSPLPLLGIATCLAAGSLSAQTIGSASMSITNQTLNPSASMLGGRNYPSTVTLAPYTASPPSVQHRTASGIANRPPVYRWKTNVVATVFWVGEASSANNPTPNDGSSWDPNWMTHYGGYDDPAPANRAAGYCPARFVPRQNPFYVALPYNDCVNCNTTKAEASRVVPWFRNSFVKHGQSVCKNHWIAIRYGRRTCYAQWSDCGPFATDDASYVFGDSPPANGANGGAGLDMAPAVRDYLGFSSGAKCDWRFVDAHEVEDGPWKAHGNNNPFSSTWQKPDDNSPIAFVPRSEPTTSTGHSTGNSTGTAGFRNVLIETRLGMPGLVLHTKSN